MPIAIIAISTGWIRLKFGQAAGSEFGLVVSVY
jgi:hypothetical protein